LVELIVVITILAILWTIAFISLKGYSRDSRDGVRISDLKNIETGLELYKTKVWKYPTANAATYTNRFPIIFWSEIWILLDSTTNEPIQTTWTGVDILKTTTNYKAYFSTKTSVTWTWWALFTQYYNRARKLLTDKTLAKNDPSLVLYMDMQTTTTSWALTVLKDLSQYWNNWTCYNSGSVVDCWSATWPQFVNWYKNRWKAMKFDWIDDYIKLPNTLKFNSWVDSLSLFVLFKPNLFTRAWQLIIEQNTAINVGRDLLVVSDSLSVTWIKRNSVYSYIWWLWDNWNGNTIPSYYKWWLLLDRDKWFFPSVSYENLWNKSNLSIYINWINGWKYNIIRPESSTWVLFIWINNNNWLWYDRSFDWLIDEVRIYNRALSDAEIMELYNSNK